MTKIINNRFVHCPPLYPVMDKEIEHGGNGAERVVKPREVDIMQDIAQTRPFRNDYHKATVNLIFTGKWIVNLHNELFKLHGITIQQYNILRILKGLYPSSLTVKMLRERMLDKMSDASRVVEHLRKKGMVERVESHIDRRKVDIIITQKGIEKLNEIDSSENEMMDKFLSNLNTDEINQLDSLLNKCRNK